jgi:uncharacterized protein (TIGR00251 family)
MSGAAARWQGRDLILTVQVQPRARADGFAGRHGDQLKIRLTAPPVDGRANEALIAFLADVFGVPKRQVQLESGETGRRKRLRVAAPTRLPADWSLPPAPGTT